MEQLYPKNVQRSEPWQVLLLGEGLCERRIERGLTQEGFKVTRESELSRSLPKRWDPNATDVLREMIAEWKARIGVENQGSLFVHPGVSWTAKSAEFAGLGRELGYTAFTPSAKNLSLFSNKLTLLSHARELGIPTLVKSFEPIRSLRELKELIGPLEKEDTFPIVLKSVRVHVYEAGIRVFHTWDQVEQDFPIWMEQIRRNTGEAICFLERYSESAQLVSVPFARFASGEIHFFPFIDGSLQARYRKIIELCPAPNLGLRVLDRLKRQSARILDTNSYVGLGQLEYLVDGESAHLVEGQAGLTESYPLWEESSDISAVEWQIATLLDEKPPLSEGRSQIKEVVRIRLFAENSFLEIPQPGKVYRLSDPEIIRESGVFGWVDWEVLPGSETRLDSNGALGEIFVAGKSRSQIWDCAANMLKRVSVSGSIQTNEAFLEQLMENALVRAGMFHAGFVDEEFLPTIQPASQFLELSAAIARSISLKPEATPFWKVGNHSFEEKALSTIELNWDYGPHEFESDGNKGLEGVVHLEGGERVSVCAFPIQKNFWQVRVGKWFQLVRALDSRLIDRWKSSTARDLFAQCAGRVFSIRFQSGENAPAHEALAVIEAFFTLVPHRLSVPSRIDQWAVSAEDLVKEGDILAEFEKITDNREEN